MPPVLYSVRCGGLAQDSKDRFLKEIHCSYSETNFCYFCGKGTPL